MNQKYAVLGGGSWATAIVKMLSENLNFVNWYLRSSAVKNHIINEQHNPNYLSSVEFDTNKLNISNDINSIVNESDTYLFL